MKILVTGFMPFGGETLNPSYEAVKLLPDAISGAEVIKAELPVVFGKAGDELRRLVRETRPDIVLLTGQAGGRTSITIERVAINCRDCKKGTADNDGNSPVDEPVVPGGADGYFATLPIKAIAEHLLDNDIPAAVSNTAGTFVCNDVFYALMHLIDTELTHIRGGFIHVPFAAEQHKPASPSMPMAEIARGLRLALEASVREAGK